MVEKSTDRVTRSSCQGRGEARLRATGFGQSTRAVIRKRAENPSGQFVHGPRHSPAAKDGSAADRSVRCSAVPGVTDEQLSVPATPRTQHEILAIANKYRAYRSVAATYLPPAVFEPTEVPTIASITRYSAVPAQLKQRCPDTVLITARHGYRVPAIYLW